MIRISGEQIKDEFAFLGCKCLFLILFSCHLLYRPTFLFLNLRLVSHPFDFSSSYLPLRTLPYILAKSLRSDITTQNLKTCFSLCAYNFG